MPLHTVLLERFLPISRRLSSPVKLTNELVEALTIQEAGTIRVVWAPFGYIQEGARVVLVGITPGRYQAEQALSAFAHALAEGQDLDDAVRQVKTMASFSGPLRANLVAMLDYIGLQEPLKLNTCADLFRPGGQSVHFTSALHYPVFIRRQLRRNARSPAHADTTILDRYDTSTMFPKYCTYGGQAASPIL
jgi:hypothetical protein